MSEWSGSGLDLDCGSPVNTSGRFHAWLPLVTVADCRSRHFGPATGGTVNHVACAVDDRHDSTCIWRVQPASSHLAHLPTQSERSIRVPWPDIEMQTGKRR